MADAGACVRGAHPRPPGQRPQLEDLDEEYLCGCGQGNTQVRGCCRARTSLLIRPIDLLRHHRETMSCSLSMVTGRLACQFRRVADSTAVDKERASITVMP